MFLETMLLLMLVYPTATNYSVLPIRRKAAGEAEVHAADTDVIYVIDGEATLVTGGSVTGGRTTAPGETRGAGIAGGTARRIAKGDVVTVPKGIPHWFSKVAGSVTYLVVKVR
jgi:quercetin dioxygenase-like cupin family protein